MRRRRFIVRASHVEGNQARGDDAPLPALVFEENHVEDNRAWGIRQGEWHWGNVAAAVEVIPRAAEQELPLDGGAGGWSYRTDTWGIGPPMAEDISEPKPLDMYECWRQGCSHPVPPKDDLGLCHQCVEYLRTL
jgi:hypothetical protein